MALTKLESLVDTSEPYSSNYFPLLNLELDTTNEFFCFTAIWCGTEPSSLLTASAQYKPSLSRFDVDLTEEVERMWLISETRVIKKM